MNGGLGASWGTLACLLGKASVLAWYTEVKVRIGFSLWIGVRDSGVEFEMVWKGLDAVRGLVDWCHEIQAICDNDNWTKGCFDFDVVISGSTRITVENIGSVRVTIQETPVSEECWYCHVKNGSLLWKNLNRDIIQLACWVVKDIQKLSFSILRKR